MPEQSSPAHPTHAPSVHAMSMPQGTSHAPQCAELVVGSTHASAHMILGVSHEPTSLIVAASSTGAESTAALSDMLMTSEGCPSDENPSRPVSLSAITSTFEASKGPGGPAGNPSSQEGPHATQSKKSRWEGLKTSSHSPWVVVTQYSGVLIGLGRKRMRCTNAIGTKIQIRGHSCDHFPSYPHSVFGPTEFVHRRLNSCSDKHVRRYV